MIEPRGGVKIPHIAFGKAGACPRVRRRIACTEPPCEYPVSEARYSDEAEYYADGALYERIQKGD